MKTNTNFRLSNSFQYKTPFSVLVQPISNPLLLLNICTPLSEPTTGNGIVEVCPTCFENNGIPFTVRQCKDNVINDDVFFFFVVVVVVATASSFIFLNRFNYYFSFSIK